MNEQVLKQTGKIALGGLAMVVGVIVGDMGKGAVLDGWHDISKVLKASKKAVAVVKK